MSQRAKPTPAKRKRSATTTKGNGKEEENESTTVVTPQQVPMGSMGPVMQKHPDLQCPHLSFVKLEKMKRKILTPTAWSCSECGTTEGVWACLTCGKIGCGRYQSEHALSHFEDYKHPLALEINLSYCYCYQCEEYVTHDNKKEDLETIRKLLLKAQTVDDNASTTRSGKAIRAPVKIPTSNEFKDEDRLHTAVKHWRLLSLGKAFNTWKDFIFEQRRKKQLEQILASPPSPASIASNSTSTPTASPVTPPPPLRTKTSFLTQSTQRALASPSASRRIIPGITGLRNLGNTCFMNTVLQALSNTSEFRDFFVHMLGSTAVKDEEETEKSKSPAKGKAKGKGKQSEAAKEDVYGVVFNGKKYTRQPTLELLDTIRKHVPKLEEVSLAMEVHSLLRVLWSGKWAVVTPCALLESVWKFVPKFRNRQQQDAQEFLCYLFDRLQLELQHANSALGPAPAPLPAPAPSSSRSSTRRKTTTEKNDDETPAKANGRRKRERSPSPPPTLPPIPLSGDQATIITETFQGKLSSKVTCSACKHTSTKLDPFLDLSVDIPVVSIAKPHRKKRRTATKPKAKTKPKQNGKTEDPSPPPPQESPPSPSATPSSQTTDTTNTSTNHTATDNTTQNSIADTKGENTAKDEPTTTTDTTKDDQTSTSVPPINLTTSDSDTEQNGPASCHLTDCLASFMKEEIVEGYSCGECGGKHDATKRLYLNTLPHVLCIVLKRFSWTSTSRAKIDTHVAIPFTLDLSTFLEPTTSPKKEDTVPEKDIKVIKKEKEGVYELRSVVMHHGLGLLSGHYTSYCYNELQDMWVHYNDARVTLVAPDQVEREVPSQAYLMFYQLVSPSPPPFFPPMFPLLPTRPGDLQPSPPASPYLPPPASETATNSKAKRPRNVR